MTLSESLAAASTPVAREAYVGSFETFVASHGASLARSAFLLTGDRALAEDLVQTALAKVSLHWDRVAGRGHPAAYVRTAVVRTAIGWRRRRWVGEVPTGDLPEAAVADETGRVVSRDRLRAALLALPARQRAAVVLRFYEDRAEADVATLMGCSVGTVKSQTAKALSRLRGALADLDWEDP